MNIQIRLPKITGKTQEEQLAQIKSYLLQLALDLQYAFDEVSKDKKTEIVIKKEN